MKVSCIVSFKGTCDKPDNFELQSEQSAGAIGHYDLFEQFKKGKNQLTKAKAAYPQERKAKKIGYKLLGAADNSLSNSNVAETLGYLELFKQILPVVYSKMQLKRPTEK